MTSSPVDSHQKKFQRQEKMHPGKKKEWRGGNVEHCKQKSHKVLTESPEAEKERQLDAGAVSTDSPCDNKQ